MEFQASKKREIIHFASGSKMHQRIRERREEKKTEEREKEERAID